MLEMLAGQSQDPVPDGKHRGSNREQAHVPIGVGLEID
jgi:hypothetical protein